MENLDYLNVKGRVFDIQRFSIHDGPGIRTIVFLKGCAMRCAWCCNPESQSKEIEQWVIDGEKKTIGYDATVKDILDIVKKDESYYRRTGGGLTLSGGESLLQPDFAAGLLRGAHEYGLSTAMESMGLAPKENIDKVLEHLDLYLYDIKHMDPIKHKNWCLVDNTRQLDNIRYVTDSGKCRVIVRTPVIPGFNDTVEEIAAIAAFADKLKGVEEIHLLPYHRLGQDKYDRLGRKYSLDGILPPTDEHMETLKKAATMASHLKVQIGG